MSVRVRQILGSICVLVVLATGCTAPAQPAGTPSLDPGPSTGVSEPPEQATQTPDGRASETASAASGASATDTGDVCALPTVPAPSEESTQKRQPPFEFEVRELGTQRDENRIHGLAYVPQGAGEKLPTVIFSHGFGGTLESATRYAEELAVHGYAVYCFDFCGGSPSSRSDGSMLDMSLLTERDDLFAVMDMLRSQSFVDPDNIFLMGESMGGAVSAMAAAERPDSVRGAILLYPAFVLVDDANERFASVEEIPDTYFNLWMTVGRVFAEDILGYDVYGDIARYGGDVLIIHGDADEIVPLSYSERAVEAYPSARLEVIPGAAHGFGGEDFQQSLAWTLEYLDGHVA